MLESAEPEFFAGTREERLPGLSPVFPYLSSLARPDLFPVPWHWHRCVEVFYMERGGLEYVTPGGRLAFPPGSGGFINANVLHRTQPLPERGECVQLLHIFDPALLSGIQGGLIEERYILPLTASGAELIPLFPEQPGEKALLSEIRAAFSLSPAEFGYELKLREALSHIWLGLLELSGPSRITGGGRKPGNDKLKTILVYVHEHYGEPLRTAQLAAAGFLSERECYRLFQHQLHMTPAEYIRSVRLQAACRALAEGRERLTDIALSCGFGSSSRFSAVFREQMGCTPLEYRRKMAGSH